MDIPLDIPHDLCISIDSNPFAAIVEISYLSILNNMHEVSFFKNKNSLLIWLMNMG